MRLPESYGGANKCADIQISPCGAYLYGSNRGHDSIVAFAIQGDGLLSYAGHTATNGRNPRCIAISPERSLHAGRQ
jgi:6-phosphogluconolactonase